MKKLLVLFSPLFVAFVLAGLPSVGIAQASDADFQGALTQLRQVRQNFKNEKAKETNETSEIGKAKSQTAREAAQQRREEARQKMETRRKETLLKLVDIQIKWMKRTEERIAKMPNIADELKTRLSGEVDAAIQTLNDEKAKIQNAEGKDAIQTLAKEVRDLFKSKHETVKSIVDAIHASRANKAVAKAEERAAAMKTKIKEMKAAGKDTAEVETELENAKEQIASSQEAVGRKAFKEANEGLKEAYQTFRGIAQKAKGL